MKRFRSQIILTMDLLLIFFCNFILFLPSIVRSDIRLLNLCVHIGLLTMCVMVFQLMFRTYDSLWRYAESREYLTMLAGLVLGVGVYAAINLVIRASIIWSTSAITGTMLALLLMLAIRFAYRLYRYRVISHSAEGRSYVAIIGAGSTGTSLMVELLGNSGGRYIPYCMLDDAPEKQNKRIQGIPVFGPIDRMQEILQNTPVSEIILAITNLTPERRKGILDQCARTNCRLHVMADPVSQLQRSGSVASNVREVQIEDLLGRKTVALDNPRIMDFVRGKTVMVTGGSGSIGSELCRQIAGYSPRRLIIVDIAENSTYELQHDLIHQYSAEFPLSVEIASVRDKKKVDQLFARYRPDLVFHAAAHKHVPLMESCPEEAVKNNVFGTYHTALAARTYGAEKFVLISTDKAVNPTNIMGATKQLCEQVLQGLRNEGTTEFTAVRFGNVLGSNGSVIPLFKKQIAYGGPVTITDHRIIRYFMTIPEAVQLVLEAGSFAKSGEVFVLDMGEPVKILDLAEKLIRLSGYTPNVDIKIEEIGLRPGEKLYEELLTNNAALSRTENEKIYVEETLPIPTSQLENILQYLSETLAAGTREDIFRYLHRLVPTFRPPEVVNAEAIRAIQSETVQLKDLAVETTRCCQPIPAK